MSNSRKITSFYGFKVIHPHSGIVSRSVINTTLKKLHGGYLSPQQLVSWAKKQGDCLVMQDVNYKITGQIGFQ